MIDPDCGFEVEQCDHPKWSPTYTKLKCEGTEQAKDLYYCRLDSASCQPLPPGLARGGAKDSWTCVPDVYNELSDPGTSLNEYVRDSPSMDSDSKNKLKLSYEARTACLFSILSVACFVLYVELTVH